MEGAGRGGGCWPNGSWKRRRGGKQKVAGSRGRPKWTQGFFVKKPCVLMSLDGAAGSPKYNKQSAKGEKKRVRVERKQLWLFFFCLFRFFLFWLRNLVSLFASARPHSHTHGRARTYVQPTRQPHTFSLLHFLSFLHWQHVQTHFSLLRHPLFLRLFHQRETVSPAGPRQMENYLQLVTG